MLSLSVTQWELSSTLIDVHPLNPLGILAMQAGEFPEQEQTFEYYQLECKFADCTLIISCSYTATYSTSICISMG